MKFTIVNEEKTKFFSNECPKCHGKGYIKKKVKKHKPWKMADEYNTKKIPCKACDGTGMIQESTCSGAGYPTATDGAGNQAIDKAPTLLGKKKKKKKKLVRRPKSDTIFVS
jgi:RecJ-like exonuclease